MDDLGPPVGVRVLERPADPPGESTTGEQGIMFLPS
jgi:hypothetical protein